MRLDMTAVLVLLLLLTGASQAVGDSTTSVSTTMALKTDDGPRESADLTSDPAHTVHQQICNTTTSTADTTEETSRTTFFTEEKSRSDLLVSEDPPGVTRAVPTSASTGSLLQTSSEHLTSTFTSTSVLTSTHMSTPPTTTTGPRPGPAGPTHIDRPSQLKVGDEDLEERRPRSALDPLLAALLSIFIITTAVVFVVLFLKLRQRTNHPEFHRLHDLPMDDLLEDTPLSRYSY